VAERLRDGCRIEHREANATVLFGDDESGHADFGQTFPEILRANFAAVGESTCARQACVINEEFRQRIPQGFLFFRQSKFHAQASLLIFGSFGMPRPRSLMMFF